MCILWNATWNLINKSFQCLTWKFKSSNDIMRIHNIFTGIQRICNLWIRSTIHCYDWFPSWWCQWRDSWFYSRIVMIFQKSKQLISWLIEYSLKWSHKQCITVHSDQSWYNLIFKMILQTLKLNDCFHTHT